MIHIINYMNSTDSGGTQVSPEPPRLSQVVDHEGGDFALRPPNDQQLCALRLIDQRRNIFLTGMAGTGKSYLIHLIRERYPHVIVTALTGTAAALINGQTLHKWSGLTVNPMSREKLCARVRENTMLLQNWKDTQILVIDEISMMTAEMLNRLNYLGQKIRDNEAFLGGICVVLSGDFAQLPAPNCRELLFESQIWKKNIHDVVYLTHVYRQTDPVF